jgi:hypothetical protein
MPTILKGAVLAAPMLVSCVAFAQTPQQLDYCRALTSSYRKAVAAGATPRQPLETAAIECSTNPVGSIVVFERGLKEMKVDLPPRG